MNSLKIKKELLDKAKKESKELGLATSTFVRQAIIDKLNHKNKLKELEKRIEKLDKLKFV